MTELKPCPRCKKKGISIEVAYKGYMDAYVRTSFCSNCGLLGGDSWTPEEDVLAWNDFVDRYLHFCCEREPELVHPSRKSKYVPTPETVIRCTQCGREIKCSEGGAKDRFKTAQKRWNDMFEKKSNKNSCESEEFFRWGKVSRAG